MAAVATRPRLRLAAEGDAASGAAGANSPRAAVLIMATAVGDDEVRFKCCDGAGGDMSEDEDADATRGRLDAAAATDKSDAFELLALMPRYGEF